MTKMDEAVGLAIAMSRNEQAFSDIEISAFHRALRERGYAVLPVELSPAMIRAANSPPGGVLGATLKQIYRAMIAAAQERIDG